MVNRPFWIKRLEKAWDEAPIVWLAGVRRSGKTTLAQSLGAERIHYINCDLPAVADMVADPELFYRNCDRPIVVFDEIHQLQDPSRLLKIGADAFPQIKILATGSSTLAASKKFRDTLTGRKRQVHLTPVLWDELPAFQNAPLLKRLFHGGLPQALLSATKTQSFYREWMDSFFARDIQRLFAFRDPDKFNALFEFVMKQSGGLLEITRTAGALGISRPTVENHLRALESTHAVTLLRPFHGGGQKEIVKTAKIYAFDTGFVSFGRGWDPLRPEDYGVLWEHLVLEFLQAHGHEWRIQYWRDASGREVDFVVPRNRAEVDVIECKWDPKKLDPAAIKVFRSYYPKGNNYLICPLSIPGYSKRVAGLDIYVCNPDGWGQRMGSSRSRKKEIDQE
jgi:predicted AAA+ superfamily ATPase